MQAPVRTVVVGGGIGGLALAQGLIRRGTDVVVLEKDADLACTGGYKLHLGPVAMAALSQLLNPELFELLLASAVDTHGFRLAVRDHRCRLLTRASDGVDGASLDVDRVTLRLILAENLGDRLVMGRQVTGFREDHDRVIVDLHDGHSLDADLVVGADGPSSTITATLAGTKTSHSTGLVGVAGRSLYQDLPQSSRDLLATDPMLAIGPGGCGLFATAHDPVGSPAVAAPRNLSSTTDPIAIWGLIASDDLLPAKLNEVSPQRLVELSLEILNQRGWSPVATALLNGSITDSVGGYRLLAADPARLAPWPSGRVTALGDAVHAMPPTGGQGAATAIRDAALLTDRLDAVTQGQATIRTAVHDYEQQMRHYAEVAVRESLQPVRWIHATASPIGATLTRAVLPSLSAARAAASRIRPRG